MQYLAVEKIVAYSSQSSHYNNASVKADTQSGVKVAEFRRSSSDTVFSRPVPVHGHAPVPHLSSPSQCRRRLGNGCALFPRNVSGLRRDSPTIQRHYYYSRVRTAGSGSSSSSHRHFIHHTRPQSATCCSFNGPFLVRLAAAAETTAHPYNPSPWRHVCRLATTCVRSNHGIAGTMELSTRTCVEFELLPCHWCSNMLAGMSATVITRNWNSRVTWADDIQCASMT